MGRARPGGAEPSSGAAASRACRFVQGEPGAMALKRLQGGAAAFVTAERENARGHKPGTTARRGPQSTACPHGSQKASWRAGAQAPTPSSRNPGRTLGGADNGRDQEGLVEGEPGTGGRGFNRGKIGEERGPLEIRGAGGLAGGERRDRGPLAGGAIAGATPGELGQLGSGSVRGFAAGHFRGVHGHVVADEPIAAAGLGRLETAQRHQREHHYDPTEAEEPRLERANAEEPSLEPAGAEEPRLEMVKRRAHGFDTLVGGGWIAAKGRPPRPNCFPSPFKMIVRAPRKSQSSGAPFWCDFFRRAFF